MERGAKAIIPPRKTAIFRIKQIFDGNLRNRLFDNQITEGYLRVAALNKMKAYGITDDIKIIPRISLSWLDIHATRPSRVAKLEICITSDDK